VNGAEAWLRIGSGAREHTVLAVDFDTTGRKEAGFADLARLLPDIAMWHTVFPAVGPGHDLTAADCLARWSTLPATGGPVAAVLGYCAGSVFAAGLVEEIADARGTRPALVLFDPERPTMPTLYRDFDRVVAMTSVLTPQESDRLRAEAHQVREARGDDFDAVSTDLVDLYEHASMVAFARIGLDEDLGAELLGMFRSYTAYLAAARELTPEPEWATAVAVTSTGSSNGARHAARELSFQVAHGDLLRHPDVANALREIVVSGSVVR
jgi:hypothetical protein